eukprot:CCRYP_011042-RC/>CCRYP_011042-RC protein AED:0.43 eAED:1.00 QI:0/-1/0/1/-1/0/1/0/77
MVSPLSLAPTPSPLLDLSRSLLSLASLSAPSCAMFPELATSMLETSVTDTSISAGTLSMRRPSSRSVPLSSTTAVLP